MSDKQKVGFIGVGLMGHGMAKNLMLKGHPLTILGNRNREPVDDLISKGATEVTSPKAVAEASDIVFLCLPNSPTIERIVLGADGVIEGVSDGMILIDTSTADPSSTMKVAESLAVKGVRFLDAPLARTPVEAEEGRLNTMVGGDADLFEDVKPVLECFCENIFHVGALGAGHTIKLLNNFLGMTIASATCEAITTARKAGIDLAKFNELVSAGILNSGMFQTIMRYPLEGDGAGLKFALANARKDVGYYQSLTQSLGVTSPVGSGVYQAFAQAVASGYGGEFVPRLADAMAKANGIDEG